MSASRTLVIRIAYLVMPSLLVIGAAMVVLIARGEALPVSYGQVAGYRMAGGSWHEDRIAYISAFERALHDARNRESLPRLQRSASLDTVAQAYAEEMAAKRFFDHVSPDGTEPFDRVEMHAPNAIIFGVRENLSYAHSSHPDPVWMRAARAHDALMDSPGHRENILHKDPTHVGIGMTSVRREGLLVDYVVQLFGNDVGVWTRGRPMMTVESGERRHLPVKLNRSDVEFLLNRPGRPSHVFPSIHGDGGSFRGAVALIPDETRSHLMVPPLSSGTYTVNARIAGRTRGWFRVLDIEVQANP